METKITKHFFEYGGNKYFRENAHNVDLGSYGEKKDPVGARAYLDVQSNVKSEHLASRVKYNTTVDINWNQTNKGDVEVNGFLKFFGLGANAAVSGSFEKAKSANLKLVNFAIHEGPLKVMLNKDANGARKFLAEEGNDGRIVSEAWYLMEGELAEHFKTAGSISASGDAGAKGLAVTASGGKHGSQTITIEEGATFAYKLHKVKDWDKGKTQIEQLEADWKGMG
jgi:hypothetical protein